MQDTMLSEEDVREKLRAAIAAAGGQQLFAEQHHFSKAYVHDVLHGRRGFADRILAALGVERVVQYREITHDIAHSDDPHEEKE